MKPNRRLWFTYLFCVIAIVCATFVSLLSFHPKNNAQVFIVQDAFDPLSEVLAPYSELDTQCLNPYQLGHQLPGLNGLAFVFGTQARFYKTQSTSSGYVPLYSATIVIAVNRNGNAVNAIDGWKTLLNSQAIIMMPHNASEGGRLAAIAIARGLGAAEGDYTPALEALAFLNQHNRLNPQSEYGYNGYKYMYNPERLSEYDAVILWDYQAKTLTQTSDDWDIIIPAEGALTADCGFVHAGSANTHEHLLNLQNFLTSNQGQQALTEAGFSPLVSKTDLSAWDWGRLTYNSAFRRSVLSVKLFAPASVLERLLLQSVVLLLFCIAAQRVLKRIPKGARRSASFYALLVMALWLAIGIAKTLSTNYDFTRYLWYATYIPRHFLPICWYIMCFTNRHNTFPPRKILLSLTSVAAILTAFVFTNDLHHQMFLFTDANPATWGNLYINQWGYFISMLWSFSVLIIGSGHFLRGKMTRQLRRLLIYAGGLFLALLVYLILYISGIKHFVDLEIPTTIAFIILAFIFAAQNERFMGASLLELPTLKYSPFGIAIYGGAGETIYQNAVMDSIQEQEMTPLSFSQTLEPSETVIAARTYHLNTYSLNKGLTVVLEDITDLKQMEKALRNTHKKLKAVQELLIQQAHETNKSAAILGQERYTEHMDAILHKKTAEVQRSLNALCAEEKTDEKQIQRIRLLICICQQRLRFGIRSLQEMPDLPVKLLDQYFNGILRGGKQFGLDGVFSAPSDINIPLKISPVLLEAVDYFCLSAFDMPGSSLICRLEVDENGVALNTLLSWENTLPPIQNPPLPKDLLDMIHGLDVRVTQESDEDGLMVRLLFAAERNSHDVV